MSSPKSSDKLAAVPSNAQPTVVIGLSAVIIAVTDDVPRVLTVDRSEWGRSDRPALPFGALDPSGDRTLELGLRHRVQEQSGLQVGYVEQLYTFGDRDRVDRPVHDVAALQRVLSVAYLALVREADAAPAGAAQWRDIYTFVPWEDWRGGKPAVIEREIVPALERWVESAEHAALRRRRQDRIDVTFGLGLAGWDTERVLERYELLYEASAVAEAAPKRDWSDGGFGSQPMAVDHRRILATGLGRLRGKVKYRPLIFELMPDAFTLSQLQATVEALAGVPLHKQNFRRLIERGGLVEGTGKMHAQTGGRPAEIFRFRHDVLRERPAPGVGLPAASLRGRE